MTEISRSALFGKLNRLAYQAIDSATAFCKLRGNPYVELVHWLHQILQLQDSDLSRVVNHFDLNLANLARDMTSALDRLPRGSSSLQDLSSHVDDAVERGWVYSTLMFGDSRVRTGHLVVGLLKTAGLRRSLEGISKEFGKINLDTLTAQFQQIVGGSPEEQLAAADGSRLDPAASSAADGQIAPAAFGKQEALRQFSVDLTEKAKKGEIDPIVARDEEIRQIIDILMRRRQNNPILTGEAGVGKTAVVEGFALRIAAGDVPPPLQNVTLRVLDVGLLQAGASYKGEFEKRLRQVIDEVQASEKPIILFIDEAHTLIGAGGTAGTGDAANLLKPALARGTLRTVAATTWAEYKKYIEKDPALTRRFQVVQINEPSEEKAVLMMRSMASVMEHHHRVQVLDEALEAAVNLSHRYIPARQLPDKSVSLLDTACARVAISQHAVPAEVDDCRERIGFLETELEIIDRENRVGIDTDERETGASEKLAAEQERLRGLEERWNAEKLLVDEDPRDSQTAARRDRPCGRVLPDEAEEAVDPEASRRSRRRPPGAARSIADAAGRSAGAAGRIAVDPAHGRCPIGGRRGRRLDRHPGGPDGQERDRHRSEPGRYPQPAHPGTAPRPGDDRQPYPDLPGEARQSQQADRGLHAGRPLRRGQDRDGPGPGGSALRRRAERGDHQHERVSGGPHRLHAQRRPPRLCRLWRGRHPDRSRAPQALQRHFAG